MPGEAASILPPAGIDRAEFLLSMRAVPGAVAIIAAADDREQTGMAATAWTSLCADPPMVLACVNQSASAHGVIRRARAFSLNVVPAAGEETVAIFSAQRGLSGRDRFIDGHWTAGPNGQPLLDTAVAAYECELVADHLYGTHSIFIGRIGAIRRSDAAEALIFLDGGFYRAEALQGR